MVSNKKLGIYWGDDGISLIEVRRDTPGASVQVPFEAIGENFTANSKDVAGGLALLETLQKSIRNQDFPTSEVYFSLPSREVIVRWIVIPFMKSTEIQGVISFEARKYIPFSLDELVYTYYPSTFIKDGLKQIGVLLVAVRKTTFDYYIQTLTQAGLNVVYSEPSSMSLVRSLVLRKTIDVAKTIAIVNIVKDYGELIITSKGVVQFIRDFKVLLPMASGSVESNEPVKEMLFNELRLSLDFFSRQHSDVEITKVVAFSNVLTPSLCAALSEDLGIPVQHVTPVEIIPGINLGVDQVHAFGAALSGSVNSVINFNLCEGEGGNKQASVKTARLQNETPAIILPVIVGLLCGAVLFFSCGIMGARLQQKEKDAQVLSEQLGVFADVPLSEIEAKKQEETDKKAALASLSLHSDLVPVVIRLIDLMPDGVWFSSLSVVFSEKVSRLSDQEDEQRPGVGYYPVERKRKVAISGYAYLNDTNAEFQKLNEFMNILREDTIFSAGFKQIKLGRLQAESQGVHKVTSFTLDCE